MAFPVTSFTWVSRVGAKASPSREPEARSRQQPAPPKFVVLGRGNASKKKFPAPLGYSYDSRSVEVAPHPPPQISTASSAGSSVSSSTPGSLVPTMNETASTSSLPHSPSASSSCSPSVSSISSSCSSAAAISTPSRPLFNIPMPEILSLPLFKLDLSAYEQAHVDTQFKLFYKDLVCSCCLEVFRKPVTLTCGHSFCHECLLEWYSSSNRALTSASMAARKTCPFRDAPLPPPDQWSDNVSLKNTVEQLKQHMAWCVKTEEAAELSKSIQDMEKKEKDKEKSKEGISVISSHNGNRRPSLSQAPSLSYLHFGRLYQQQQLTSHAEKIVELQTKLRDWARNGVRIIEDQCAAREAQVAAREQELAMRERELASRERQSAAREKELKKKEKSYAAWYQRVKRKEKLLQWRSEMVAEQMKKISAMQKKEQKDEWDIDTALPSFRAPVTEDVQDPFGLLELSDAQSDEESDSEYTSDFDDAWSRDDEEDDDSDNEAWRKRGHGKKRVQTITYWRGSKVSLDTD